MGTSQYAGRTVTRARYNNAVKRFWQARADAWIKKYWLKLAPAVATTVTNKPVNHFSKVVPNWTSTKRYLSHVQTRSWKYTAAQNAQNAAATARDTYNRNALNSQAAARRAANAARQAAARRAAIELARKNKFTAYQKKAWGSRNINYRKIKNEVNRYAPVKNKVREANTTPTTPTNINTKKAINSAQYNALINKYWDTNWVINAIKANTKYS